MRIEAPTFPLSSAAFDAALRTGHGRVIQQLDGFGSDGREESAFDAEPDTRALVGAARDARRQTDAASVTASSDFPAAGIAEFGARPSSS